MRRSLRNEDRRLLWDRRYCSATQPLRDFIRTIAPRGGPITVDDIHQETLLIAWQRLDSWPTGTKGFSWLRQIARNVCSNHFRTAMRRKRRPERVLSLDEILETAAEPASRDLPPEHEIERLELEEQVVAALRRLTRRQREIMVLIVFLDYTIADVAKALGMTVHVVRKRYRRGCVKLSVFLKRRNR